MLKNDSNLKHKKFPEETSLTSKLQLLLAEMNIRLCFAEVTHNIRLDSLHDVIDEAFDLTTMTTKNEKELKN